MTNDIVQQINDYFGSPLGEGESRKILYLFDAEQSYKQEIEKLSQITDFVLITVNENCYFWAQHQLERAYVEKDVFLYFEIEKPDPRENPLLDVLYYSKELKIDEKSQLFFSIGVDSNREDLHEIMNYYPSFFKNKARINQMKKLFNLSISESAQEFEYSIIGVLVKASSPNWMSILISLFEEPVDKKNSKWDQLIKFGNINRFWVLVDKLVEYNKKTSASGHLTIYELMKHLFMTFYESEAEKNIRQISQYVLPSQNSVVVFMNRWKNARKHEESYKLAANSIQNEFDMDQLFEDLSTEELVQLETFRWFDEELIRRVIAHNRENANAANWIAQRKNTIWFKEFEAIYEFLSQYINLSNEINKYEEKAHRLQSFAELQNEYVSNLYRIDQYYRVLTIHFDKLGDYWTERVSEIYDQLSRQYNTVYLGSFSEKWDHLYINSLNTKQQSDFYAKEVRPFVESDKRIVVFISDGLRFEAGQELYQQLTFEKRFDGEMDWMQTDLPSITKIGVANLLPHQIVSLDKKGSVKVDNQTISGLSSRQKALEKETKAALAVHAKQLTHMNRSNLRQTFKGKKLIYIFHDIIDAVGDNQKTEDSVFQATDETIDDLHHLISRLTTEVSINHFLITSDHGYIYNREKLKTMEKTLVESSTEVMEKKKRYLITKNQENKNLGSTFSLKKSLNFDGYVTVPKGLNRYAVQGGGAQYVHGGALPQEIIVPLLRIRTNRGRNELDKVGLILITQTRRITELVTRLSFLQAEPVSSDKLEAIVTAYFVNSKNQKISNEVTIRADKNDYSNDQRVFKETFILLDKEYDVAEKCYLILEDFESKNRTEQIRFDIDII